MGSALGVCLVGGTAYLGLASSHREAPLISADPLADNTDTYAFVSPDAPNTVTLIANWIPLEAPGGGPNFYKFGDDVLYRINVDNNGDAKDDIVYEFRFKTRIQNKSTFLYSTSPIASLDDPNFNMRQTYSVTRINRSGRHVLGSIWPRRRSTSGCARRRITTRSATPASTRCRTARKSSPANATIRFSSISVRCSICSGCGRSIPRT